MTSLAIEPQSKPFKPEILSMTDVLIDNLVSTRSGSIKSNNNVLNLMFKTSSMLKADEYTKYIKIQIWGEEAILMLSNFPLPRVLEEITTEKELCSIPQELAVIALSIIYEDYIDELSKFLSTDITLLSFSSKIPVRNKAKDHYKHRVHLSIGTKEQGSVEATLLFGREPLQKIIHIINTLPMTPWFSPQKINSCLYFEAGETSLNKEEVSTIESGDILMIDSDPLPNEQYLTIRASSGHKFLAKKTDSLSYRILEKIIMEDNNNEQNVPLDEIPLLITFDLGGLSMSLDEITKLGVGYTLDLKKDFTKLVTIRINNKAIGKGEIVDVGSRAGVRITHLENK